MQEALPPNLCYRKPMARCPFLSQWPQTVSSHMAHLSKPQATVLALWSFGMLLAQSCGMTSLAASLAALVGRSQGTLRPHLRECWCQAPRKTAAKRADKRQERDVSSCFLPLMRWVVACWPPAERRLALALDASTLGQRFTVLAITILDRGCAIAIAWLVLPSTSKGAWRADWERLFTQYAAGLLADWTVSVLADRGVYARFLSTHIQSLGWHLFLRNNLAGNYREVGAATFRRLPRRCAKTDAGLLGAVSCCSRADAQLPCRLLARWDAGHADA
jgi:hypothetical protein